MKKQVLNVQLENKLKQQTAFQEVVPLTKLPHFSEMKNLVEAAKLFKKWIMEGKRGLLIADYDADGIFAAAILMDFLAKIGITREIFDFHVPSRLIDGYGLSENVVQKAIDEGYDFIVTVDNGVTAMEAVQKAKDAGLGIIITDHHTVLKTLPNANIVVCPKQKGETFPFIDISGATVAWYFIAALKDEFESNINLGQYIDWVAVTIMSDVMPLTNINLSFLEYGLKIIKSRKREIYRLQWNPTWTHQNEIDEISLSFGLVSKFNAVGRIDDANLAVEILLEKDKFKIKPMFDKINVINAKRQVISREQTYAAEEFAEMEINLKEDPKVLVLKGPWDEGIVGIIAGRLAQRYKRPAYVLGFSEEKQYWKGSARTSGNIHLYDVTTEASDFVVHFGGHRGAVGVAVTDANFDDFKEKLIEITGKINPDEFINHFLDPIECSLSDIDLETFDIVRQYAPYGQSNPLPTFLVDAKIIEASVVGKVPGLHWKAKLEDPQSGAQIDCMLFNVHPRNLIKGNSPDELSLTSEVISLELSPTRAYDAHNEEFSKLVFASFHN